MLCAVLSVKMTKYMAWFSVKFPVHLHDSFCDEIGKL